ncbi:MAG: SWIM zinc finger family protein, partial [Chthoniobacteraceae bacterium]
SEEQRDAIQQYLDSIDEKTRERGLRYFAEARVNHLENDKRGVEVSADVAGTKRYRVKLHFVEGEWDGECSCPMGFDCKHCVAVALQALALGEKEGMAAQPEPPVVAKVVVRRERPQRSADATVAVLMADRLGRKLSLEEKRTADAVDKLFQSHRNGRYITEMMLEPITRIRTGWGWNSVQVWPEAPRTQWEAWLYVAGYLRQTKHACPPALLEVTDWAEVDALTAEWERRQRVEQWRACLQDLATRAESAPPETASLRVRLGAKGMQLESRKAGAAEFAAIKANAFARLASSAHQGQLPLDEPSLAVWRIFYTGYDCLPSRDYTEPATARVLNQFLRLPGFENLVVGPPGTPFVRATDRLQWRLDSTGDKKIDYRIALVLPDGSAPRPALTVIDGTPSLYVTADAIYEGPPLGRLAPKDGAITVPAEALETSDGLTLLERIGVPPPPRIAARVRTVRWRAVFRCAVKKDGFGSSERMILKVTAEDTDGKALAKYLRDGWSTPVLKPDASGTLTRHDRSALSLVPGLVESLRVTWDPYDSQWHRQMGKNFAAHFTEWLATV